MQNENAKQMLATGEISCAIMFLHAKAWRAAKSMTITFHEKWPARKWFRCSPEQHLPAFFVHPPTAPLAEMCKHFVEGA